MIKRIPMQKGDFGFHEGSSIEQFKYRLSCDICGANLMVGKGGSRNAQEPFEDSNNFSPILRASIRGWLVQDTGFSICPECLKIPKVKSVND